MNKEKGSSSPNEYIKVLGAGSESLADFLEALQKFDREFCEAMFKGHDFTLKLEVHGNKGEMLHARCICDTFRRPDGAEKRLSKK